MSALEELELLMPAMSVLVALLTIAFASALLAARYNITQSSFLFCFSFCDKKDESLVLSWVKIANLLVEFLCFRDFLFINREKCETFDLGLLY